jgi:hypothetical protein
MAEDNRFWNLMAKTKLLQELDGQKWIKKTTSVVCDCLFARSCGLGKPVPFSREQWANKYQQWANKYLHFVVLASWAVFFG